MFENSSYLKAIVLTILFAATVLAGGQELAESGKSVPKILKEEGWSGRIVVLSKDKVTVDLTLGFSDREAGIKTQNDTAYYLASVSKQFTAAAILKLVEMGKLRLEESIADIFESVPEDKKPITIHQLLSHTSGMYSMYGSFDEEVSLEEHLQTIFELKLKYHPGTRYSYSNIGYNLLAAVIEKRSGQPYAEFIRETILLPAGMTNTGFVFEQDKWPADQVAVGLEDGKSGGNHISWDVTAKRFGAAGMISTTGDLLKWRNALLKGAVISEESFDKMTTPYMNNYGYGIMVYPDRHGKLLMHGGSFFGFSTLFLFTTQGDYAVIVLNNEPTAITRDNSGRFGNWLKSLR